MDALTEKYNRLTAEAGGQVVVDLSKDIHYSVSDIIGEMVFGVQFGMVASGKEHEFMQWFDDIQRMLALVSSVQLLLYLTRGKRHQLNGVCRKGWSPVAVPYDHGSARKVTHRSRPQWK